MSYEYWFIVRRLVQCRTIMNMYGSTVTKQAGRDFQWMDQFSDNGSEFPLIAFPPLFGIVVDFEFQS